MNFSFLFLILYLSIFGGAIGVFAKIALIAFSPLTTIFFRILISLLFFSAIFIAQKRFSAVLKTVFGNWKKLAVLALACVGAAMITGFIGLRYTTAINYGLIYNLSSIFILIFSVFWLGEKLKKLDALFIFLAFFGAGVIATNGKLDFNILESHVFGDFLVLISAVGWALYSVLGAKFSRKNAELDSPTINFGTFLIAFIALLPVVILSPSYGINFPALNLKTIVGLSGLSVFSTAILFFLWLKFVDKQGGIWATIISLSENLAGVLLPIVFLSEKLTLPMFVGGVLIIAAVFGKEYLGHYHGQTGEKKS